jgi:hypothetical protein
MSVLQTYKTTISVVATYTVTALLWDAFYTLEAKSFGSLSLSLFVLYALLRNLASALVAASVSIEQVMVIDVMLRMVMGCFLIASYSIYVQAEGLSGPSGLIPLSSSLKKNRKWHSDAKSKAIPWHDVHLHTLKGLIYVIIRLFEAAGSVKMVSVYCIGAAVFGTFVSPHPLSFVVCYVCYFGIRRVLPEFLNLQWDALLLEAGATGTLLSVIYACEAVQSAQLATNACMLLFKVLLFRLMLGSGMVKYFSGDVSWRDGTAMNYHFLTQPLPGTLAPFLHAHPVILKRIMSHVALFGMEVVAPLASFVLMILPLDKEVVAAGNVVVFCCYGALQLAISMGGNFGFFNLLSQVLALSLLQDTHLAQAASMFGLTGAGAARVVAVKAVTIVPAGYVGWTVTALVLPLALLFLVSNVVSVLKLCRHCQLLPELETMAASITPSPSAAVKAAMASAKATIPQDSIRSLIRTVVLRAMLWVYSWGLSLHSALSVFSVGCHYGLFAHMTKTRDEVLIEVSPDYAELVKSLDGDIIEAEARAKWLPVPFLYKPGSAVDEIGIKRVSWPPLHMPRLDWRLWFVPLNGMTQALGSAIASMRLKADAQYKKALDADDAAASTPAAASSNNGTKPAKKMTKVQQVRLATKEGSAFLTQEAGKVMPRWLLVLLCGVLEADKAVCSLLGDCSHLPSLSVSPLGAPAAGEALSGDAVMNHDTHVRVTLARYDFATAATAKGAWQVGPPRTLLPPVSLGGLFSLLDAKDGITVASSSMTERDKQSRMAQMPAEMQPETAADIIKRALLKGRN